MNIRGIVALLGIVLIIIGLAMLLPMAWSLYYADGDWKAFLYPAFITLGFGMITFFAAGQRGEYNSRDAFAAVTLSWIAASVFASLPYMFSGVLPTFADAFFETMSGFTTTGASVFSDVENLPHGILFWRSLTHWLGGMGIVVLFVALLSSLGAGGMQMFKAEAPGPVAEKIKPRISETAKILWMTYVVLTILQIILLWVSGMSFFDALCHAFGTLATGGFSTKNASIGFYEQPLIQWIVILFMFMAGANFTLYFQALRRRNLQNFWRNIEFRVYLIIVAVFIVLITAMLAFTIPQPFEASLRQAAFQVVSVITTTGYATADFGLWPFFIQALLVILMFIGGCSGSTSGSIKVGRILILTKQYRIEMQRAMHPRGIFDVKVGGKHVGIDVVINVHQFFFIYMLIVAISVIIISLLADLDIVSSFTAVAATLGNVGPGLGRVGPMENYGFIPAAAKYYLSFLMLLGRLELYTALVFFLPSFWKK